MSSDRDTHPAMGPQVVYSPGAPVTGSGVVYPGTGSPIMNLYFAAPWLSAAAGALSPSPVARSSPAGSASAPPQAGGPAESIQPAAVAQASSPGWAFTGQVGEAFRVAGLARHSGGLLFAAATTSEMDEANTGTVFRSDDGGATWEPVPVLPLAWWLDSILATDAGTLLVSGMMYEPGMGARGVIYRSIGMGESWSVVFEWPGATISWLTPSATSCS